MNPLSKIRIGWLLVAASVLPLFSTGARAQSLSATWNAVTDVPVTSGSYTAAGNTVTFTLNVTPPTGTTLTVISDTGSAYITGTFDNLAQGQLVPLTFNGVTFNFAANYFGGSGKDLTLQWANNFAFAWGSNTTGQLGDSGTANSPTPVQVTGSGVLAGKTIDQVSAGQGFSAALTADGSIATWGDNSLGQLGDDGAETSSTAPVLVDSSTDSAVNGRTVIAIAAGANHALSLTSDGAVESWGDNSFGQLGNSGSTGSLVPVLVDTSTDSALNGKSVTAIAAGADHSLALSSDGSLEAWGNNGSGQLGDNGAEVSSTTPVLVDSSSDSALFGKMVTAIAAGANHSLALCSDGSIATWGSNASGQLGNSGSANSLIPVAVDSSTDSALNGKTVVAVSAGTNHSLALCSDGTIVAWGDNSAGELGNSGTTSSLVPVGVNQTGALSGKTVTAIAAGNNFSLALCSDGSVAAWGDNTFGQLGISGSQANSDVPVAVDSTSFPISPSVNAPVIAIAAGPQAQTSLAIVAEQGPPVIEVQQPAGVNLVSGSSVVDFGSLVLGTTNQLTYTVVND
ncbi:MAG TPA: hypothetical protein VHY22_04850, partial [Chthoniobacteraceae bacterium]|nr:hypothetical protein [Chthoniobacteraceae bacterium]